jgi:hypothetical protein
MSWTTYEIVMNRVHRPVEMVGQGFSVRDQYMRDQYMRDQYMRDQA